MRRWCSSVIAPPPPPGCEAFLQAVKEGDHQEARRRLRCTFLRRRELLNSKDQCGVPALHWAVRSSNTEMLRLMLRKGADVRTVDSRGETVLHQAARGRDRDLLQLLLDNGGNCRDLINQKTKHGHSPLHTAVRNDRAELVSLLLEHGADINMTDGQGWSALHLAVIRGHSDCVVSILHLATRVDLMTRGWTSLHLAALTDRVDIVSLLINAGADTSLRNAQGKTPLDIARDGDNAKTAAIILEREFQSGLSLPSPPPTPASETKLATLERWRAELSRDLSRFDKDDLQDEEELDIATEPIFEEEKSKLIQQIEKVKQRQVADLKTKIKDETIKHEESLLRISRRAKLLVCEIQGLQENIPGIRGNIERKFKVIKKEIIQLSEEIDVVRKQFDVISKLKTAVSVSSNKYVRGHLKKTDLVQKLLELHERELRELSELKIIKMKEVSNCESEAEKNVQRVVKKIHVLQEELSSLEKEKNSKINKHKLHMIELEEELRRAETRKIIDLDDKKFHCPLCLGILKPEMKIFQCPEGHILCESCYTKSDSERPRHRLCPHCQIKYRTCFSRNRALEAIVISNYNRNKN